MKYRMTLPSIVGTGILVCAMSALAQDPTTNPPSTNPPTATNPPRQNQPPRPERPDRPERPVIGAQMGHCPMPRGAAALDTTLTANTIQVCAENDFKGKQTNLSELTTAHRAGTINEIASDFNNKMTSARWNLDPGVVVIFYSDASGKGDQLVLWGKGQFGDLSKCDFNNKASRWAWYDIGGGKSESAAGSVLPHGAQPIAGTLAENTIQLFEGDNFKEEMQQISPITTAKACEPQPVPGKNNSATSLKWNLPEGVIVLLGRDADSKKQIAIWGQGQVTDLGDWDFNNAISRYTWGHIGSPMGGMRPNPNNPNEPKPIEPGGVRP